MPNTGCKGGAHQQTYIYYIGQPFRFSLVTCGHAAKPKLATTSVDKKTTSEGGVRAGVPVPVSKPVTASPHASTRRRLKLVTSDRETGQPLFVENVSGEIQFYVERIGFSRIETIVTRKSDATSCSKAGN